MLCAILYLRRFSIINSSIYKKYYSDIFTKKSNDEKFDRVLNVVHELFDEIDRKNLKNLVNKHDM